MSKSPFVPKTCLYNIFNSLKKSAAIDKLWSGMENTLCSAQLNHATIPVLYWTLWTLIFPTTAAWKYSSVQVLMFQGTTTHLESLCFSSFFYPLSIQPRFDCRKLHYKPPLSTNDNETFTDEPPVVSDTAADTYHRKWLWSSSNLSDREVLLDAKFRKETGLTSLRKTLHWLLCQKKRKNSSNRDWKGQVSNPFTFVS